LEGRPRSLNPQPEVRKRILKEKTLRKQFDP
jgi:hypothetical protein